MGSPMTSKTLTRWYMSSTIQVPGIVDPPPTQTGTPPLTPTGMDPLPTLTGIPLLTPTTVEDFTEPSTRRALRRDVVKEGVVAVRCQKRTLQPTPLTNVKMMNGRSTVLMDIPTSTSFVTTCGISLRTTMMESQSLLFAVQLKRMPAHSGLPGVALQLKQSGQTSVIQSPWLAMRVTRCTVGASLILRNASEILNSMLVQISQSSVTIPAPLRPFSMVNIPLPHTGRRLMITQVLERSCLAPSTRPCLCGRSSSLLTLSKAT